MTFVCSSYDLSDEDDLSSPLLLGLSDIGLSPPLLKVSACVSKKVWNVSRSRIIFLEAMISELKRKELAVD